jgi:hypothetical protein
MTRTANAKLILDIEDDKLDPHIQRVREAKTQWDALGQSFKEVTGTDMNALKGLMSSFATEIGKVATATGKMKMEPLAKAVVSLDTVLGDLNPKLGTFVTEMTNLAPIVERVATASAAWSKAIGSVATSLGRLEDRIASLTESQIKADKHIDDFATKLIATNTALKTQGQEMLRVLQAYAGFNKATDEAAKSQDKASKSTKGWWAQLRDLERAFIRHSTVIFILQQQVESLLSAFTDAATEHDLMGNLGKSITGFSHKLEAARESTRNTISDLALLKSAALMSSFGLDMTGDKFASNMEMVQKLAIRTGQDAGYLADSFGRGIARLSPAILDNLGLQIKLTDAYAAYAATIGVATDALSAQQKKTAVLNEVLRQGMELTEDVDPAASYVARIQQAQARVTNFFNGIKIWILGALVDLTASIEERVGISLDKVAIRLKEIRELGLPDSKEGKNAFIEDDQVTAALTALGKLKEAGDEYLSTFTSRGAHERIGDFFYGDFDEQRLAKFQQDLKQLEFIGQLNQNSLMDLGKSVRYYNELMERKGELENTMSKFPARQKQYKNELAEVNRELETYGPLIANARQQMDTVWAAWIKIDEAKKRLKGEAAKLFPEDTASQNAWINTMLDGIKKLREGVKETTKLQNFHMDSYIPGLAMETKLQALREKSTKAVAATSEEHLKANKVQFARLAMLDFEIEKVQLLAGHAQDMTDNEVHLSLLKKEVSKEQGLYNKMRQELTLLDAEAGKYSVDELAAQKDRLDKAFRELAVMEAKVSFEKDFAKALNDTSVLSKDLQKTEAERLAGGKTRNELEAEYVNLRIDHAIAMEWLAEATAHYYEILYMGSGLEADLAADALEEAERKLDALKADIVENRERLASMPKNSSGGGGGSKDKAAKEHGVETVTEDFNTFLSTVTTGGSLALREIERRVKFTFDKITGALSGKEELSNKSSLDLLTPDLMSPGLGKDVAGALARNEEILAQLDEFQAKGGRVSDSVRDWANNVRDVNDELREHLELMEAIATTAMDAAIGIKNAFAGGDELIGDDWLNALDGLQQGLEGVAAAAAKNADAYELVAAGMPAIRGFTKEFIKDLKLRAFFEMMMNAAMAWAAYPNVPKMVAHGTAAVLYGAVFGGAVKLPSKATKDTKDKDEGDKKSSGAPINVYLYGEMIMSEGQLGVMVEDGVQQARAEGRL